MNYALCSSRTNQWQRHDHYRLAKSTVTTGTAKFKFEHGPASVFGGIYHRNTSSAGYTVSKTVERLGSRFRICCPKNTYPGHRILIGQSERHHVWYSAATGEFPSRRAFPPLLQ